MAVKKRSIKPAASDTRALDGLVKAMLTQQTPAELRTFLIDLCTPAELQALADRWRVVPLLVEGAAYRDIHERTAVSVTTVGRIARCLEFGAGGYRRAVDRLGLRVNAQH